MRSHIRKPLAAGALRRSSCFCAFSWVGGGEYWDVKIMEVIALTLLPMKCCNRQKSSGCLAKYIVNIV